jgi:hypothetical protein
VRIFSNENRSNFYSSLTIENLYARARKANAMRRIIFCSATFMNPQNLKFRFLLFKDDVENFMKNFSHFEA